VNAEPTTSIGAGGGGVGAEEEVPSTIWASEKRSRANIRTASEKKHTPTRNQKIKLKKKTTKLPHLASARPY
jgi:hypothetical protein